MASMLGDGSAHGGPGPARCLLLLQRSLAIQLSRGPPPQVLNAPHRDSHRDGHKDHPADEMWMYDKGYNLFQVSFEKPRSLLLPALSGCAQVHSTALYFHKQKMIDSPIDVN